VLSVTWVECGLGKVGPKLYFGIVFLNVIWKFY